MERVSRAFLFHEALATQDEGASLEEALAHVLWYYPSTASQRERVKQVGLAQALLSFSSRFNQRADDDAATADRQTRRCAESRGERGGVEMVRTRHHSHGFFQCEPGVWLVMVIRNRTRPSRTNEHDQEGSTSSATAGATFSPSSNSNKPASTPVRRFHAAVFGRANRASSQGSSIAGRASPSSTLSAGSGSGRSSHDGQNRNNSPNGTRTHGGGGGGGGGSGGDWVDESSLRAAMAAAYETFALLHGPIQRVLDAPIRVHDTITVPSCSSEYCHCRRRQTTAATLAGLLTVNTSQAAPVDDADAAQASAGVVVSGNNAAERRVEGVSVGDGDGGGDGGLQSCGWEGQEGIGEDGIWSEVAVSGGEVLRRLASARKRLRRARRDVVEAPGGRDSSVNGVTPEQQPETEIPAVEEAIVENSDPSPELERLVRTAESEIASLLPLSPVEKLRETLAAFFEVYFPRAGLGQPHFHLDMGYPQSLPMDFYRQQLGLRMQRRLRDRIRAACRSRHRCRHTDRRGAKICADSVSMLLAIAGGALLLTCAGREPVPGDDNAQAGVSAGRTTTELFGGRTVSSSGSGAVPGNGARNGGENGGVEAQQSDGFFGGKEASLLLGYLSAVASSAAAAAAVTDAVAMKTEVAGGGELSSSGAVSDGDGVGAPSQESIVRPNDGEAVCDDAAGGRGGSRAILTEKEGKVTKSPTLPSRQTPRRSWKPWRYGDSSNGAAGDKNSLPATANGNFSTNCDNAGVSLRERGVNGDGRTGRETSWMSRGENGGLLCWDGGVVACGRRKNSSGGRGGSGGGAGGEGGDEHCCGKTMDYGIWSPRLHSPRAGRNRRVVVYLRGGLCAVLAFEEELEGGDKNVAYAPDAVEVSARADREEGGGGLSGENVVDEGVDQSELLALGEILQACLAEEPDLAVLEDDALDLYTQTVAAPTPSPTPSSRSRDGGGALGGASSAGFGGFRSVTGRTSKPSSGFSRPPPALRAVQFSPFPVSCFSGAGLVKPPTPDPPAPTLSSAATVPPSLSRRPPFFSSSSAARSPYTSGGEFVVVSSASPTVSGRLLSPSYVSPGGDNRGGGVGGGGVGGVLSFPPSPTSREDEPCGNDATGCGGSSLDGIGCGRSHGTVRLACGGGGANDGRSKDGFLRVGAAGLQQRGGGFRALIEAFARRGRADIGVEELRRRPGEGGEQQLAALDDFHATLRGPAHPLAEDRYTMKVPENGLQQMMCDGEHDGGGGGDGDSSGGLEDSGTLSGVILKGGSKIVHTTKKTSEFDGRADLFQQQQRERVQEIGLRTSMSKGNRWVIGSRIPRETGAKYAGVVNVNPTTVEQDNGGSDVGRRTADIRNGGGGELYVVVEAPILSVGDARAAAEKLFLQGGDSNSGGANGRGNAGIVRSSNRTITSRLRC